MARASIEDIAQAARVNRSTVSRALNGKPGVSARERERIRAIAAELNYRPNPMARGLAGQKTRSVGLIGPSLRDQFFVDMLAAMERRLNQTDYSCLLGVIHGDAEHDLKTIENLRHRGVDGFAIAGTRPEYMSWEWINKLAKDGIPVALYTPATSAARFEGGSLDLVTCDVAQGCYEMTRHILEQGHRRIALIGFSEEKEKAHLKALSEYGVAGDAELFVPASHDSNDVTELWQRVMSLKERPTAIIVVSDDWAAELMMALTRAGYRIPEEVSIAGVNDSWFSELLQVPLTTVRLPAAQIGEALAEMLTERIENPALGPRARAMEWSLVKRKSIFRLKQGRPSGPSGRPDKS